MDASAIRKLMCTAKAPLKQCGETILQHYKDDVRKFGLSTMLWREIALVHPAEWCKKKVGRGRCKTKVIPAAIIQLCRKHQFMELSDDNLETIRYVQNSMPAFRGVCVCAP